jgi:RNA-directed DNA polymerase
MIAPPLLVSYSSLDDYLASLSPELREQYEGQIRALVNRGLPPVVSAHCLATLFGYSTKFVYALKRKSWKYYRNFTIQQGKKKRKIQAPKVSLKVIQKWFGFHLAKAISYEEFVYGFVEGRSALDAAAVHTNAKWVYSIDIKDFFPSTSEDVLKINLQSLGYSEKASDLITALCCHRANLAQGSPSSPVLSNLVMRDIDSKLHELSIKHGIRFTRYADDIVFSGQSDFPEELRNETKALFETTCWELSQSKEYFAQLPKRLKVHGLLVHQDKPRLTKGYRNKIRAFKHMLEVGKVNEKDLKRLSGHIKYAEAVEKYKS